MIKKLLILLALVLPLQAEELGISEVGWSADGKYLVTIGGRRRIRVHDGATGKLVRALTVPGSDTVTISFSPDSSHEESNSLQFLCLAGDYALTGCADRNLYWWKIPELKIAARAQSSYAMRGLTLSAGGKVAACTSTSTRYLDSEMELLEWDGQKVKQTWLWQLPAPDSSESFGVPRFSPDGGHAIAFACTGLFLWDLAARDSAPADLKDKRVLALGNQHFFVGEASGVSMRAYSQPEQEVRRFECPGVTEAVVDERESRLLLSDGGTLRLWRLDASEPVQNWTRPHRALAASADLQRLALWQDKRLEVWDFKSHKLLYKLSLTGRL